MSNIDQLFQEYSAERQHELTQEQFSAVLKLVPGLLVASSDGVLDPRELILINKFAKMMGDELIPDDVEGVAEKEEKLMNDIANELQYMVKNISKWEEKILDALAENIKGDKRQIEFVAEAMQLLASTSGGLSAGEEKRIDELYDRLGLA